MPEHIPGRLFPFSSPPEFSLCFYTLDGSLLFILFFFIFFICTLDGSLFHTLVYPPFGHRQTSSICDVLEQGISQLSYSWCIEPPPLVPNLMPTSSLWNSKRLVSSHSLMTPVIWWTLSSFLKTEPIGSHFRAD